MISTRQRRAFFCCLVIVNAGESLRAADVEPVVIEAEEFLNLAGCRVVSSLYLRGTPCSNGKMIRCGDGEPSTTIQIPTAGAWHVWVQSHGAPGRSVRVRIDDATLATELGTAEANWTRAGKIELPAGPASLVLTDSKGGPYVDVILLTRDESYDPEESYTVPPPAVLVKGTPVGRPECVRKIDLADFGGMVVRYGDLDGDGEADAVVFQSAGQQVTCITAVNLQDRVLWQRGKPDSDNSRLSSDIAAQVYDIDGDGHNEVLVIEDRTLRILDGRTGDVEQEHQVPSNDSILIANFTGAQRPGDLLIKDRYSHIWAFDNQMNLLWESKVNCGHYPMNIDIDRDGHDELICGYRLYSHDGNVIWDHPEFGSHNDAVDADDMDGDGIPEVAIACSRISALMAAGGEALFTKPHVHSQHAVIGAFCPDRQGKQAVFVDRISASSANGGIVYCYLKDGTELWHTPPQGGLTIASTIDGWTGEPNRSFVCLYRRACGPPVLVDGKGQVAAEFPFSPAKQGGAYGQYFVQHFDVLGDSREEVLVNCTEAIWVYTNAEAAPPGLSSPKRGAEPRIYNASFYVRQQ